VHISEITQLLIIANLVGSSIDATICTALIKDDPVASKLTSLWCFL